MKIAQRDKRHTNRKDRANGGLFYINVDDEIVDIERRLGDLSHKAPVVLAKALNDTAKWAGRELAKSAQEQYRIQKLKFAKEFRIKNASKSDLSATITAEGTALAASKFKLSQTSPVPSFRGSKPVRLAILKKQSPEVVTSTRGDGLDAFVTKFQSGHNAVVQREPPREYKSKGWGDRKNRWAFFYKRTGRLDKTRVQELYGPSVPKMLEKVGVTENFLETEQPKILEHLQQSITKHINTEIHFADRG